MVRNRSSLVFYFLNKVSWVSLSLDNKHYLPVVLANKRKKLTLRVFSLGPATAKLLLSQAITARTRLKFRTKVMFMHLNTTVTPFFNAFSRTNQYFTILNPVGLYFTKRLFLTTWLHTSNYSPRLAFINTQLSTSITAKFTNSIFFDVWINLWSFKYFRTPNQTCNFFLQFRTPQTKSYFDYFTHTNKIVSVWRNFFLKQTRSSYLTLSTDQVVLRKPLSPLKYSSLKKTKVQALTHKATNVTCTLAALFRILFLQQLLSFYTTTILLSLRCFS